MHFLRVPGSRADLQPVPKRNTEVFEVLIGQLRKNVGIYLICAKYGLVLIQAEASQPIPDVHDRIQSIQ